MATFRGVCQSFQQGLAGLLAKDAALAIQFDAHTSGADLKHKRVWVAVRLKPQDEDTPRCVDVHHNRITARGSTTEKTPSTFYFDGVFSADATQSQVWTRVGRRVLSSLLERKHVCFFAYGQTGSGKTHTMFGDRNIPGAEGVAFRALRALSRMMKGADIKGKGLTPRVEFSFLEVYNEKVFDLLAQQKQCELQTKREVKEQGSKYKVTQYTGVEHVVAKGLTRRQCDLDQLEEQVGNWLYEGACTRTVGATVFNEHSSRSHAVATMHIRWEEGGNETRLYLVDLAGSERAGQYALSAEQLQQGVNINKSLSTMGRVITVLASGSSEHVPYRDSTLTWLLSDAITGLNARAFMIATANPLHGAETMSTLQYAQQYSNLRSNQEERNKLGACQRKTQAVVHQCRTKLAAAIADTNSKWTRSSLTAQRLLGHREPHQTKYFFKLLAELEHAEQQHEAEKRRVTDAMQKAKEKELKLIRQD